MDLGNAYLAILTELRVREQFLTTSESERIIERALLKRLTAISKIMPESLAGSLRDVVTKTSVVDDELIEIRSGEYYHEWDEIDKLFSETSPTDTVQKSEDSVEESTWRIISKKMKMVKKHCAFEYLDDSPELIDPLKMEAIR